MSRGAVNLPAALAVVAGVIGAVALSRGGTGGADRQAFFADVARRLDLKIPRPPRPSMGARPAPGPQHAWRWGGRGLSIDAGAGYLGMTPGQVRERLHSGTSPADVSRLHVGDDHVQQAIGDEVARRLAALNDEQRRPLVDRLEEIMHRDGRPDGGAGRGGP